MLLIFSFIFNHYGANFSPNLLKVLVCFELSNHILLSQESISLHFTITNYEPT